MKVVALLLVAAGLTVGGIFLTGNGDIITEWLPADIKDNKLVFIDNPKGYKIKDTDEVFELSKNQRLRLEDDEKAEDKLFRITPKHFRTKITVYNMKDDVIASEFFDNEKLSSKGKDHINVRLAKGMRLMTTKKISIEEYEKVKRKKVKATKEDNKSPTTDDEKAHIERQKDILLMKKESVKHEGRLQALLADNLTLTNNIHDFYQEAIRSESRFEHEHWIEDTQELFDEIKQNAAELQKTKITTHDLPELTSIQAEVNDLVAKSNSLEVLIRQAGVATKNQREKEKELNKQRTRKDPRIEKKELSELPVFQRLDRTFQKMYIYHDTIPKTFTRINELEVDTSVLSPEDIDSLKDVEKENEKTKKEKEKREKEEKSSKEKETEE